MASAQPQQTHGQQEQGVPAGNQRPGDFQLTEEEMLVMRECGSESFWYRELPYTFGAVAGSVYLMRKRQFAGHPRFGIWPYAMASAFPMYLFSKLSYIPQCKKKILEKIPNSNLAQRLRDDNPSRGVSGEQPSMEFESNASARQSPAYSQPDVFDDRTQPPSGEMPEEKPKSMITYEELRRRNREDYEKSRMGRGRSFGQSPDDSTPREPPPDSRKGISDFPDLPPDPTPPQAPRRKKRTNMWGDEIDD